MAALAVVLGLGLAQCARAQINGFNNGVNWTTNAATNSVTIPTFVTNSAYLASNSPNATSIFYNTPQYIGNFTASFIFQNLASGNQEGFVFALQDQGTNAVGEVGGNYLGFVGINPITGIAFDFSGQSGRGPGVGYAPNSVPHGEPIAYTPTGGVNLASTDPIAVTMLYTNSVLTVTVLDQVTKSNFSTNYNQYFPADVESTSAYVGFTAGGTGALNLMISNFVFNSVVPTGTPISRQITLTNTAAQDVSMVSGNESDGVIALNPTAPNQLFVVGNTNEVLAPGLYARWNTNSGSGAWQSAALTNLPPGYNPAVAWDALGNLFLAYSDNTNLGIDVAVSTNGGQTFKLVTNLATGDYAIETKIAVGSGTGLGSLWVLYHDYSQENTPLAAQGVSVSGLTNFGAFGAPLLVPGAINNCGFGDIVVGPGGQVMVGYQDQNDSTGKANIWISVNPGLGSNVFGPSVLVSANGIGGNTLIPAEPNGQGLNSSVALGWDSNPNSQQYTRAYAVYTGAGSATANDLEIYMATSTDNGMHWTYPTRVNDDLTRNSKFMPRLAIDPTDGAVGVSWYDCRNDNGATTTYRTNVTTTNIVTTNTDGSTSTNAEFMTNITSSTTLFGSVDKVANDDAELFVTVSLDGGLSFAKNISMSTNPSESFLALDPQDYGDYNGLAFYGGTLYPVWSDNSSDFSSPTNPDGPTNKFDTALGSAVITGVADVSVSVVTTNWANPLTVGEKLTYLVTVSNAGPATATGIMFTNIFSPYLLRIEGTPSVGDYTLLGSVLSWPVGTLGAGSNATLLVEGTVGGLTSITNYAAAGSTVVDVNTNNNVSVLITPVDSPDLAISMSGSVPIVGYGKPAVTYTISVTNLQPISAQGVKIVDALPSNLKLTNWGLPPGATVATNQTNYTITLGTLLAGQSSTVYLTAIGVQAGFATNSAVVSDIYLDPDSTNNIATAVTQVSATYQPPVFALGIQVSPSYIGGNETAAFTYSITNVGPVASAGVYLSNYFSTNLTYVSVVNANLTNLSNSVQGAQVFYLGALATNQSTNITVTANGTIVGSATDTASVADALGEGGLTNSISLPVLPPLLSVTTASSPAITYIGGVFTNTLTYSNSGLVPAYFLAISDQIATNVALESVSVSGVSGTLGTNASGITCVVNQLNPGQTTTLSVTAVGVSNGLATNTATAFANFSQLYTNQIVTAVDPPNLLLSMTGLPSALPLGHQVTYQLQVLNLGPVPAFGVTLSDFLPPGLTISGMSASQGSFSNYQGVVAFNLGSLGVYQEATAQITATAGVVEDVFNTAYVAANSGPPPIPSYATDTVETLITNAPQPYNVTVVPGVTSAFITFDTPFTATAQVAYGLTTNYGSFSFLNTNLTTHHAVLLTGLQPDTNYDYEILSVTYGVLTVTNSSFATSSSVIMGTSDASYSANSGAIWTADTLASAIYPTNNPSSIYDYTAGVSASGATASATYFPNFPTAGKYNVYIWYPSRPAVSTNTPVIINGATNAVYASVNQATNGGSWQLIAPDMYYATGASGSVTIYNNTGSAKPVMVNAMRWSYDLTQDVPTNGGVPAWWANFYFGGNVSGAADELGNGYSNYADYVLGVDPTSASAALQFVVTPGPQTNTISFAPYQGGRLYQLLSSTNLQTGWQTLTNTAMSTTNGTGYFSVPAPTTTGAYYRLSVSLTAP